MSRSVFAGALVLVPACVPADFDSVAHEWACDPDHPCPTAQCCDADRGCVPGQASEDGSCVAAGGEGEGEGVGEGEGEGQACAPEPEVCNGQDDDCNGVTDEDAERVGETCQEEGAKGVCADRALQCTDGLLRCAVRVAASD